MSLQFKLPSIEKRKDAIEYIEEFLKYDSAINGTGGLDIKDYKSWLKRATDSHNEINIQKDKVPASTYFAYHEDTLVGMVNIRHNLNEYLISSGSGHIGYSVRPTQRRKEYATLILKMALKILKNQYNVDSALLGCYKENVASMKTIISNGGIFEREIVEDDGKISLAYTIKL